MRDWDVLPFSAAPPKSGNNAAENPVANFWTNDQPRKESAFSSPRIRHWSAPVLHEIRRSVAADQQVPDGTPGRVLTVDSAELLRGIAWLKLRHSVRDHFCVVTLHQKRRIPVLYHCRPDVNIFLQNCWQLLQDSPTATKLTDNQLLSVYQAANQNSREAFFQLYEQFARM